MKQSVGFIGALMVIAVLCTLLQNMIEGAIPGTQRNLWNRVIGLERAFETLDQRVVQLEVVRP